MARTFTWVQAGSGNFDGPGNWADITSGTREATLAVPGSSDIAEFDSVAVTVGSASPVAASTVDVAFSVVTMIGSLQFGALDIVGSTLDIAALGTMTYVAAFQAGSQVAVFVGSGAHLVVAGAGAALTVQDSINANGYLMVGASGTLAVGAGANVRADVLDLTGDASAAAVGSIDGGSATTGGTAELVASWVAVGDGGIASLTLTNGALVTADIVTVGFGEDTGIGAGTLLVTAAGQMQANSYAVLGYSAGDVGVATIDGAGSVLASAGLFVGNNGGGALTVQNGATLMTAVELGDTTSFAASIANAAGGTGIVGVQGIGSTWTIAGRTVIGDGGPGALQVLDGAAVRATVGPVAEVINGATVYDGSFSLTDATVAVQGVGSTLDAGGGPIYVGNAGRASVWVLQGGAVSAAAPAPDFAAVQLGLNGGTGTLVVSGAGSHFTTVGQIDVGGTGSGDVGTLEVLARAMLVSGGQADDPLAGLVVGDGAGSSGVAGVDGAGSAVSNDGRLDIGRSGTGRLTLSNGALLVTQLPPGATMQQPASVLIGVNAGASGTLVVDGSGSLLTTAQNMIVGLGGSGTLLISNGGKVEIGSDLGVADALGSGVPDSGTGVVVVAGGTLEVDGALTLGGAAANDTGSGSLTVGSGGLLLVAGLARIATGAALRMAGGVADLGSLSGGTVDFIAGGTLRLHAATSGTALIVGADGGTIDLVGITADSAAYVGGMLSVDIGGATMTMQLAAPPPRGGPFIVSDGAGGTDVVMPCFAAGTRLATPSGPVAVEMLRRGDVLRTATGGTGRVVWVGRRTLDCRRHLRPAEVLPVRVCAGAFAPGVPSRDVRLSPDHALLVEGSLIPVRYLLTGSSIVQEAASRITYCHVELASHDVLLAEGLPCESFLDTGNRRAFASQDGPVQLHPEFGRPALAREAFARAVWAQKGCAPLLIEGPAVERARGHFLDRAAALGHRRTRDPALRLLADGRPLLAAPTGQRWQVELPRGIAAVRLASRIWVPAHMRPAEHDSRVLGVAIARLTLDGREVALDSPALAEGWHAPEAGWRWTDGAGMLPVAGARRLAFDLVMVGDYWAFPAGATGQVQPAAAR